jgi:hypothetical protein
MHPESAEFVHRAVADFGPFDSVVEYGGRDVNGSARHLFGIARYTCVDLRDGPGVDVVADARTWTPRRTPSAVVTLSVYEHLEDWRGLLVAAHRILAPGGHLVATTVCDPFPPHSAEDGGDLRPGEWYANVEQAELTAAAVAAGFEVLRELGVPPDSGVVARKPSRGVDGGRPGG